LKFNDDSFYACPIGETGADGNVYQIFAAGAQAFEGGDECIGIVLATAQWDGMLAWEYN